MSKQHPGFASVAGMISRKQGVPISDARAMLAAGTRRSSAAARRKNPRLARVRGKAS